MLKTSFMPHGRQNISAENVFTFFNAAITINHRIVSIQKRDGKVNMNEKFKFSIKFYKKYMPHDL